MKLAKAVIFYLMLWCRGLFLMFGKLLAGLFLLGTVLSLFFEQIPWYQTVVLAVFGVCTIAFCHFYDSLLLRLNPTGNELRLYQ